MARLIKHRATVVQVLVAQTMLAAQPTLVHGISACVSVTDVRFFSLIHTTPSALHCTAPHTVCCCCVNQPSTGPAWKTAGLGCDFSSSSSTNSSINSSKQEFSLTAEDRANSHSSTASFTHSSSSTTDYGTDSGTATSASDSCRAHDETGYCDGDCGSAECAAAADSDAMLRDEQEEDTGNKSDCELESELRGIAEDFASDDLLAALQQAFDDGDDAALAFDSPLFDDDALLLDATVNGTVPSPDPVAAIDSAYASAAAAIAGSSSSVFRI
jgi:hypothetical protein